MRKEIDKNDLYDKYIKQNIPVRELMKIYNCGRKAITNRISEYGFHKQSVELKKLDKDTLYDLYIKQNMTAEEIGKQYKTHRQQIMRLVEIYEIRKDKDKINESKANTLYKRTGYRSIMDNPEYVKKQKESLLKAYGVDNPMKSKQIRDKAAQTNYERYGVKNPAQNEEIKKKYVESTHKTMQEKYGLDWACQLKACYSAIGAKSSNTKPNLDFAKLLDNNKIQYTREFVLNGKSYDFKVDNILIEIDPTSTHNSTWSPFTDNHAGLDKLYHKNKSDIANANGYRCIHIFDWDNVGAVINLLKPTKKIMARKCKIKEVDKADAIDFINKNHLQFYALAKIHIGLYLDNELISIMTFGKPRYNNSYEYELIRYCSSCEVTGGAQKLFKYFLDTYNPNSIISYCDLSKFNGAVYKSLGFEHCRLKGVSKHWYCIKTKQHVTDNLLRKLGADKILKTNYGKGTNNEKIMLEHGFVEVYDCGQDTWTYKKTEN